MNSLNFNVSKLKSFIGNTPLVKLQHPTVNLVTKLEYCNFSGSVKDRAGFNIIKQAIHDGYINEKTIVIESSSGNLAIALASICKSLGLRFISVIDPNINKSYEKTLHILGAEVKKVNQPDITEGFLLTRIETVKQICRKSENIYWTNQYENENNYKGYQKELSREIVSSFDHLDYVFLAVSSGGTITGLSIELKKKFPRLKVIAVDIDGSIIFGGKPKKRFISGIGASKASSIIDKALIDDVIKLPQSEIIEGCNALIQEQMIFAGASTGAVYLAIKKYFDHKKIRSKPNVLFLCCDRGIAYIDTIYNKDWVKHTMDDLKKDNLTEIF